MDENFLRFLKSLKIENVNDFDMSFEACHRNRFNRNQIDMIILKETPWEYHLAEQFQQALHGVDYPYYLRFVYTNRPKGSDVITLLGQWYQSIYRIPLELNTEEEEKKDVIHIHYISDQQQADFKEVIQDFRDYLNFLCYEFVILEDVVTPEVAISKKERKILEKNASKSVEEVENTLEQMKKEEEIRQKEIEADIAKNIEIAAKEKAIIRERYRLNKHGNYKPVDFIDAISSNSGSIEFSGKVFKLPDKDKIEKRAETFGIRDKQGGCIMVKIKISRTFTLANCQAISKGDNVLVRGVAYVDKNDQLGIYGHNILLLDPDVVESEPNEEHRVELHTHTIMSEQDGVNSATDYVKYAKALGHKAIAFTDHGVVQSFPEAEIAGGNCGLKIIYGCEFYMVEDKPHYIFNPSDVKLNKASYVVLDLESTGLSTRYDKVTEFGAAKIENGRVVEYLDILINPECEIPAKIVQKTGITQEMVANQPTFKEVMPRILDFIKDSVIVTHNAEFDFPLLEKEIVEAGGNKLENPVVDTLPLSQYLFPNAKSHRLGVLCKRCGVEYDEESAHRAEYDARVLSEVWFFLLATLTKDNPDLLHKDLQSLEVSDELLTHMRGLHCVVIAKNQKGLRSLYELVSLSHITYMADIPKLPRREIIARRENLIIGSACLNGEVFRTARNRGYDRLKEIVSFYDYIEIQPPANYSILVNTNELTNEQIIRYQKDIIQAADELHIPVVATGDVHYLTREEKIFRDIFIANKTNGRRDHPLHPYKKKEIYGQFDNPDQHFRTTQEMLDIFSEYLGEEKAYEIVVTNSNKIADLTEKIEIIKPKYTCAPKSVEFDNALRDICAKKLKEVYGEHPDEVIVNRMNIELDKIIKSEMSVVYYYCHLIIKKAVDDGYIVGSRGSVGSSFVATLMGITEVNPLAPHYICPDCKHFEWSHDEYPDVHNGYDLKEKTCPICGAKMKHDGVDIPFETFLGTEGENKVPDIDLNFARDYQATAHDTLKELAGEKYVFRAGTIGTVAEKTAFAYAKKYLEEDQDVDLSKYPQAKIEYLASGCVGVKKQTGRHAGGVIIIPRDRDINEFVPIQYPAENKEATWFTTHFDYRSMHDLLLKFDLLGQLEPMTIKICRDLTGVSLDDIPMNDEKVLSLFTSPKALNMKNDYLKQKTGALGLPEFGTNFVRQIIEETKPTTFEDLVVIQGLSHGTDVWTGNAQDLIREGVATLKEIIGCRDDIMMYLQRMGISKDNAFKIMEIVRKKDKFLTQAQIDLMKANNVPDFYIQSCDKIKYLFPKAHAVAYTIMAMRTGYFKVYYPLEYYAAYLSVKLGKFNILALYQGEKAVIQELEMLNNKALGYLGEAALSEKEKDIRESLEVGLEMIQRGYSFTNVNINKSDATNFVVDKEHGCLIPPLNAIDGLGEANALSVIEARKDGEFTSIEDLSRRTKLTKTNIQALKDIGALNDLNETDQISLF